MYEQDSTTAYFDSKFKSTLFLQELFASDWYDPSNK